MHNEIPFEELQNLDAVRLVDVRTPSEYAHAHIPGASSLPVLTDPEHARVSEEYVQGDRDRARAMGVAFVSGRLPHLFDQIQDWIRSGQTVVLYCWRGGYRSHAPFSLLHALGMPVHKLSGGFKAYRRYVNRAWPDALRNKELIALYGNTGTGKTELLHALARRGAPVIDLEALANHRGSLLGAIGLGPQPSQKMFESLLQKALFSLADGPVYIEGESRKVGDLFIPEPVFSALQSARKIHITAPMPRRIARLAEEYAAHPQEEVTAALARLVPFLGQNQTEQLIAALKRGETDRVIRTLLEQYYDPKYNHAKKRYEIEIAYTEPETTLQALLAAAKLTDASARDGHVPVLPPSAESPPGHPDDLSRGDHPSPR